MDKEFWHDRWRENDIGFHELVPNPRLTDNVVQLNLNREARVFVPLCGKTLDIHWLLDQGFSIVGVELDESAIQQLFDELDLSPEISSDGEFIRYQSECIEILVGDFFKLQPEHIGKIDAIYDRAAMVALPEKMRRQYSASLVNLGRGAPQLLVTFEYDQAAMEGPPFSISSQEVDAYYRGHYSLKKLYQQPVAGLLKAKVVAQEIVWLLR